MNIYYMHIKIHAPGDQGEFEMYSKGLEELAIAKYAGRFHWGKRNYASQDDVSRMYSDTIDEFNSLRMAMDPHGMFRNEYLKQRLGYDYLDTTM